MVNVRFKLILSGEGARGDFVAGWTGLLPNVINNWWSVDPVTGRSNGSFDTRPVETSGSFEQLFLEKNLILDPASNLIYVGPMHGYRLDLSTISQLCATGAVDVYYIDISKVDYLTIHWEFIVKTFLIHRSTVDNIQRHSEWLIDQQIDLPYSDITNDHRIAEVKTKLNNQTYNVKKLEDKFLNNKNVTVLDYQSLFQPSGSSYLCDKMGLSADDTLHKFWDTMLPVAKSPESINVWGYQWSKQDFN
jgi:hypothetical protein